jgi:branched-subunit amino acid ABC-type transport system permease component
MLGAYAGVTVLHLLGSFWLALVLAPVLLVLLGAALEVALFRRLYGRGPLTQVAVASSPKSTATRAKKAARFTSGVAST